MKIIYILSKYIVIQFVKSSKSGKSIIAIRLYNWHFWKIRFGYFRFDSVSTVLM